MGELPEQRPGDVTVLDMEASIEHLTRGTVRNIDVLLVVTEPYFRSLETTGRLVPLARELGLETVWVVANKVRSPRDEAAIREYCARRGFDLVAVVPFDEGVVEADRQGSALIDAAPTSAAVKALEGLADRLAERLPVPAGR
jgi:CO dehydrogenase maturation factor